MRKATRMQIESLRVGDRLAVKGECQPWRNAHAGTVTAVDEPGCYSWLPDDPAAPALEDGIVVALLPARRWIGGVR